MAVLKISAFSKHLKELRIVLCQKSPSSQGAREFIENHYVSMKKANPRFPILIRECSGIQPVAYARYEHGKETSAILANMQLAQVVQEIEKLAASPR